MGPPSHMRPVVGRNVVMRRIPVFTGRHGIISQKTRNGYIPVADSFALVTLDGKSSLMTFLQNSLN
jgi:hypothetical protein